VLAYLVLDLFRQARGETGRGQVLVGIQQRERAAFDGQIHRSEIRLVAHDARDVGGEGARLVGVVAQTQHHQRVTQPGETQPYAPFVLRFQLLFGQRPRGHIQHVVQHAHRDRTICLNFVVESPVPRRVFTIGSDRRARQQQP
jgi:hypothetical protein